MVRIRPMLLHFPTYIYIKPTYSNHQSVKIDGLWMGSSVAERLIFVIRGSMVRVHPRPRFFPTACEGGNFVFLFFMKHKLFILFVL